MGTCEGVPINKKPKEMGFDYNLQEEEYNNCVPGSSGQSLEGCDEELQVPWLTAWPPPSALRACDIEV